MNYEIPVTKADRLNGESVAVPERKAGAMPRPIRKRGFHRALKRNDAWAVHEQSWKSLLADTNKWMFSETLQANEMYVVCGLEELLK